jgi:hypothetical protein
LAGLNSLDTLSSFYFDNIAITSLTGLENTNGLRTAGFVGLEDLASLSGFPISVTEMDAIGFFGLPELTSLSGLEFITKINGGLKIERMDKLQNLNGLSSLTECGDLEIDLCNDLTSVTGLSSLTKINGHLYVGHCPKLDKTEVENWAAGINISEYVIIEP